MRRNSKNIACGDFGNFFINYKLSPAINNIINSFNIVGIDFTMIISYFGINN